MTLPEQLEAEREAEDKIRSILLDLECETGKIIDWVRIDTRTHAGCAVEIMLKA